MLCGTANNRAAATSIHKGPVGAAANSLRRKRYRGGNVARNRACVANPKAIPRKRRILAVPFDFRQRKWNYCAFRPVRKTDEPLDETIAATGTWRDGEG